MCEVQVLHSHLFALCTQHVFNAFQTVYAIAASPLPPIIQHQDNISIIQALADHTRRLITIETILFPALENTAFHPIPGAFFFAYRADIVALAGGVDFVRELGKVLTVATIKIVT